jgi:predicted ribosomally synthesized peptide with nif11-like leader
MAKGEVERFVRDIKTNTKLQAGVKAKASGLPSLLEAAKAEGYNITVEDVQVYARSQGKEVTEEQLKGVAAGRPIPVLMQHFILIY